jgi:hypothetical protein
MRSRSIKIYLLNGDPEGIRSAQIVQSTTLAVAFRKLQLSEVKNKFDELSKAGVYLLLGYDEASFPIAYVGQSEGLAERLRFHSNKEDKNFWTDTIILSSIDENLTVSHARYVEARLIADAQKNVRWNLVNNQRGSEEGKLPLPERDSMEQFIEDSKTLVGALGCDLFKTIAPDKNESSGGGASIHFFYKGQDFDAQLRISPSQELILQKDSKLKLNTAISVPEGVVALRTKLLDKAVLLKNKDYLILTSDYVFKSVSAAASMVSGSSVNGRTAWKTLDGKTFSNWEMERDSA